MIVKERRGTVRHIWQYRCNDHSGERRTTTELHRARLFRSQALFYWSPASSVSQANFTLHAQGGPTRQVASVRRSAWKVGVKFI